jgi:hypothetical protein
MNSTIAEVDDSWIEPLHKKELLKTIKEIYATSYTWADDVLMKCLIWEHYKQTINNIDKEKYLQELEEQDDSNAILENMF